MKISPMMTALLATALIGSSSSAMASTATPQPADPSPPADVVPVDPAADNPPGVPPGPQTQTATPQPADPTPPADVDPISDDRPSTIRGTAREIASRLASLTGGSYVLAPCRIGRPSTCRARTTGRHGCTFRIVVTRYGSRFEGRVDHLVCRP